MNSATYFLALCIVVVLLYFLIARIGLIFGSLHILIAKTREQIGRGTPVSTNDISLDTCKKVVEINDH
ncbi:hypothetical protein ABB55_00190 [Prosthecomicrobium hirschii]|uniref:Uncharacterized protein n=1 Tax=Prosthecodimorpha hirschii TaxID=665126 RepID=A0A0P6VVE7_9HYPH|nr:hypothetical protein ABB55_00190 [Prosthecomicrobium hirschii]